MNATTFDVPRKPPTMTWPAVGERIFSPRTGVHYVVTSVLGEGHFSRVYGATDDWDNCIALKVLNPSRGTFEQVKAAAERELHNLLVLRNPFITYLHEGFEYRNAFYLVTEQCHEPLSTLIQRTWFSGPVWVKPVARSLLQAAHYIHKNGMVHKDIHLGNVMTTFARNELVADDPGALQFKLGDLGLSKIAEDIDAFNTVLADWMLPPESLDPIAFGRLGALTDLYHIGLVLLQVHLGQPLHFTREQILAGAPRDRAATIPGPTGKALAQALRRHTEARHKSAVEFWRALSQEP